MGQIYSSGLLSLVAVGAGDGGAIANAIMAFQMPTIPATGVKLIVRRVAWRNRIGINADLLIGYADRTVAGALFRLVFPRIRMVNGVADEWTDMPIMGNTREGFMIDTAAVTGSLGDIYVETDTAGVGAAPLNVEVTMDVEVI